MIKGTTYLYYGENKMLKIKSIVFICLFLTWHITLFAQSIQEKIDSLEREKAQAQEQINKINEQLELLNLKLVGQKLRQVGVPKVAKKDQLIEHQAMLLTYSEQHEQAKWVAHMILPLVEEGGVERTDNFRTDPQVKTGTAVQKDYFRKEEHDGEVIYDGYGFDRGHLAPSADFRWSQTAVSQSYYYSNIAPMKPDFNREGWADLEMMLRDYVVEKDVPLFVVTGGVLKHDLPKIKRSVNSVSIPQRYYKVLYNKKNEKAIAFLLPHKEIQSPVESYSVSIDSLERLTGIDFFYKLEDGVEETIEKQNNPREWLTGKQKEDVPPIPMSKLGKGEVNTIKARQYIAKEKKVEVCGTVVSTHKSDDGHVFMNLDKSFPNQIFSVTIWDSNLKNFSYRPEKKLLREKVCIYGKVEEYKGKPAMYIKKQGEVRIIHQ